MTISLLRKMAKTYTEQLQAEGLNIEVRECGAYGSYNFNFVNLNLGRGVLESTGYGTKKEVAGWMAEKQLHILQNVAQYKKYTEV